MDIEKQQRAWETFWGETRAIATSSYPEARPIWDSDPDKTALTDLARFKSYMDASLPLVDYGCGNGTQTVCFAQHFSTIVGTDVSAEAVAMAAQFNAAPNVRYRALDALKLAQVEALHDELGDVNLYVRTVLHFLSPNERVLFGEGVRMLLGERGTLYVTELSPKAPSFLSKWIERNGMPRKLERIVSKGIEPGPVGRADIEAILPPAMYDIVSDGECVALGLMAQTDKLDAEGRTAPYEPPMYYAVVRRARTKQ
jgi:cyclopropane fatty-acyl-phospholipid synthase-like methyltransferase